MKKDKRKTKGSKTVLVVSIIVFVLILISSIIGVIYYNNYQEEQERIAIEKKEEKEKQQLLNNIKTNYNEFVLTSNDTKLYKLVDTKYIEVGQVSKDSYIVLEQKGEFSIDNQYFKIQNSDYYLLYKDVTPTDEQVINYDYKNYIPFDFDIITKDNFGLYLGDKVVYTLNSSMQFPVMINDDNSYHVEFDNRLYQIKKEDVASTVEVNRNLEIATNIGVLNYHFFYDPSLGESCNETICLKTSKFEEQLQYLKSNNFYTATMNDMSLWMAKKIRLPKKTTVLTVDDGAMGTGFDNGNKLIPLLEKYDLHATLFLITAWWQESNYISPNLEVQSHGHDIHDFTQAVHPVFKMTKEQLLNDFATSINALGGEKTAFCYPFYAQNNTVVEAVRESGFKIAFVGGNVKANQNNNPYLINRYVILSNISMNQFINMVN